MKIIDIRNTQEAGWVADVLLNEKSMLPISIPVAEVGYYALEDFANSDPSHIRTAEVGGTVTDLSASLHDAGFGDAGPM